MIKTFRLVHEQTLSQSCDEVFAFFADARNLEVLTPPWLRFQILTPGGIEMRSGTIIQYALRVHGLPIHWTTAITVWNPPHEFVDVQLRGPYLLWHHRHTFLPQGRGTRMIDEVDYALPYGPLGRIMHRLFVQRDLRNIFGFRAEKIRELLAAGDGAVQSARELTTA